MSKLNFFTAVAYQTPPNSTASSFLEKVDNYFYLGGKKAYVIQGGAQTGQEKVILSDARSSLLDFFQNLICLGKLVIFERV